MQGTAQRPMGITIIAVLAVIGGAINAFNGIQLIGLGIGSFIGILALLVLVLGVAELAFGYGAWTLQPWAWQLGVGVAGGLILLNILFIIAGAPITSVIISMIVAAALLYYLFTPEIKRAFGQA